MYNQAMLYRPLFRGHDVILKEWSEALDVYKAASARWRRSLNAIMAPHKMKSYWYVWVALLLFALLVTSMVLYSIPAKGFDPKWWILLPLLLSAMPIILCWACAIEKAIAKEFAQTYSDHGILQYPFWSRRTYFNYVLFLDELKDRKYSHEQVTKLSGFAEIATPPEVQLPRLTQNPLYTTLLALLLVLTSNSIINSDIWKNEKEKALTLSIIIMLLGCVIAGLSTWYPFAHRSKAQHQTIQRYLKWAERDLKEKQFS